MSISTTRPCPSNPPHRHKHTMITDDDLLSAADTLSRHDNEEENTYIPQQAPDGITVTEKNCPCLTSTGAASLDVFFKVVPGMPKEVFDRLMSASWTECRNTTIKLVFHMGNCRKSQGGKLDQHNFIRGLYFLYTKEPSLFAKVDFVRKIAEHGCYRNLLDLLCEIMYKVRITTTTIIIMIMCIILYKV